MDKDIYIVAGGTSLKGFDFSKLKGKDVIAINKSILDVPFAKYFITMDYTFIDKKLKDKEHIFDVSKATKIFILNLCPKYMSDDFGRVMDLRNDYIYKLDKFDMIIKSHHVKGIGWNFKQFAHGNNSGFSALQLAICLGYKNIHLLGYDLRGGNETHYHGGYNQDPKKFKQKLQEYLGNFVYTFKILKIRKPDIKIYGYSPNSPINKWTVPKKLEDIK